MSFHIGDEVFVRMSIPDLKIQNERGKIIKVVLPRSLSLNSYCHRTMVKIQFKRINYTTWVWEEHLCKVVVLCA